MFGSFTTIKCFVLVLFLCISFSVSSFVTTKCYISIFLLWMSNLQMCSWNSILCIYKQFSFWVVHFFFVLDFYFIFKFASCDVLCIFSFLLWTLQYIVIFNYYLIFQFFKPSNFRIFFSCYSFFWWFCFAMFFVFLAEDTQKEILVCCLVNEGKFGAPVSQ